MPYRRSPAFQYTNVFQIHLHVSLYLAACLVTDIDIIVKCKMGHGINAVPFTNLNRVSMWGWMIDGRQREKKPLNLLFRFSRLEPILGKRGLQCLYSCLGVGALQWAENLYFPPWHCFIYSQAEEAECRAKNLNCCITGCNKRQSGDANVSFRTMGNVMLHLQSCVEALNKKVRHVGLFGYVGTLWCQSASLHRIDDIIYLSK